MVRFDGKIPYAPGGILTLLIARSSATTNAYWMLVRSLYFIVVIIV
jgi:hypothetical protein